MENFITYFTLFFENMITLISDFFTNFISSNIGIITISLLIIGFFIEIILQIIEFFRGE